jgi:16S rRNA C967 or C1407 C5-methylase (RsmB/RsmF family)
LVYATCSVFQEENHKQIEYFTQTYGLTLEREPFSCFPEQGGKDGFFAAILKKPT